MEQKIRELSGTLKALGDKTRLTIVKLLLASDKLCVGAITKKLGATQPAISQHMKILKQIGIVNADKSGYFVHYSINYNTLAKFKQDMDIVLKKETRKPCNDCGTAQKRK